MFGVVITFKRYVSHIELKIVMASGQVHYLIFPFQGGANMGEFDTVPQEGKGNTVYGVKFGGPTFVFKSCLLVAYIKQRKGRIKI